MSVQRGCCDARFRSRCAAQIQARALRERSPRYACSTFALRERDGRFSIQANESGFCAGLGEATCEQHRSTGGSECGGIDHRYLPLVFGDCGQALMFSFTDEATFCEDEFPGQSCFGP